MINGVVNRQAVIEIEQLLHEDKKFQAIKVLRTVTGFGLKESKDAVEGAFFTPRPAPLRLPLPVLQPRTEVLMTEAQEVADSLLQGNQPLHFENMDHARRMVRNYMQDETHQVIDNVAEALYFKNKRLRAEKNNSPT